MEKENNIKPIKNFQEEKNTLEKQVIDLKTLNVHLEVKLHIQQNKETQELGPNSIDMTRSRQPTHRTDQERERKENKKTQEKKEINKKNMYINQTIMKSKTDSELS